MRLAEAFYVDFYAVVIPLPIAPLAFSDEDRAELERSGIVAWRSLPGWYQSAQPGKNPQLLTLRHGSCWPAQQAENKAVAAGLRTTEHNAVR
jgi:hypothetical protein